MIPFDYLSPETLDQAIAARLDYGADARVLAGGTDLTVGLRHGAIRARAVIDLKRIADLRADITEKDNVLRVPAATTMSALERYLAARSLLPALRDAAAVVGSIQIRNRATLSGNICNASPAADTVPVLAALGASVELTGPGGTRECRVEAFIEGNRRIDLAPGELVTAVHIPVPAAGHGCAFDRITRRRGVDLATANLCCIVTGDGETTFAFGSVAPRPLVVRSRADVLHDRAATADDRAPVIAELCARAKPISDVRSSAAYRTGMLCVMAERALGVATQRARGAATDD